jgi:15-cis-phytoene desaturase
MSHHVIVLGGGVGGMSAAHELIERGFRVTVYERGTIPGGKARSFGVPGTGTNGRRDLPAEHGFRFFPGFYRHLPDTMKRIPYGQDRRTVFDNLVDTTQMQILFNGKQNLVVPSRFPRSLTDIRAVLDASGYLTTSVGLTVDDIQLYCERVWRLLTSCEERRAEELEGQSWWTYIDAEARSQAYQAYLGRTPRVLVAADPKAASTKTVGDILVQLLFNLGNPGVAADRVLNGPTNDVWIDPWLMYLKARGVEYRFNTPVTGFRCANGRITAVRILDGGVEIEETADYYVAALPVEKMAELITTDMLDADPTLEGIQALATHVDWMNGIQFYFQEELPLICGHQMFLGSPWALTSLSQAQFWYDDDRTGFTRDFGDGTVRTVLSVDVSDWKTPGTGTNGRPAIECSRDEVAAEVWKQLKASLPELDLNDLHPTHPWALDPAIKPGTVSLTNAEPLLVNQPNSWALRPWARTRLPNLFLAADYVRTHTNLATMEAANEAARRAVNGIIDASGARVAGCQVWDLHEPVWVKAWRAWDLFRYRRGQAWTAEIPEFVETAGRAVLQSAPSIGSPDDYADFTAREVIEGGIGLVPSYVQQDLVDVVFELGSVLDRGDVEQMRTMFTSDAVVVLDAARADAAPWLERLARFYAEGGRIGVDIRRLDDVRPEGRGIVARFVANVSVLGDRPPTPGRPGRLQVTLVRPRDPERRTTPGPWLISLLNYQPGGVNP